MKNAPLGCSGRCCVDPADLRTLNRSVPYLDPATKQPVPNPLGTVAAFTGEGGEHAARGAGTALLSATAASAPPPNVHHERKRSLRAI